MNLLGTCWRKLAADSLLWHRANYCWLRTSIPSPYSAHPAVGDRVGSRDKLLDLMPIRVGPYHEPASECT